MTAKRKAGRLTRAVMDRKEWDFEQIPPSELEACFCYEYGRELTRQWPILQKSILLVKTASALERKHRNTTDGKAFKPIRHIFGRAIWRFSNRVIRVLS
jgi:hypothetical protein